MQSLFVISTVVLLLGSSAYGKSLNMFEKKKHVEIEGEDDNSIMIPIQPPRNVEQADPFDLPAPNSGDARSGLQVSVRMIPKTHEDHDLLVVRPELRSQPERHVPLRRDPAPRAKPMPVQMPTPKRTSPTSAELVEGLVGVDEYTDDPFQIVRDPKSPLKSSQLGLGIANN